MGWLDRALKALRHPLRMVLLWIAVGVVLGPFAPTWALVVAGLSAVAGVIAGELLGRSRLRTLWVAMLPALGAAVVVLGGRLLRGSPGASAMLDPVLVLQSDSLLRYGGLPMAIIAGLRGLAIRHRTWLSIELIALGAVGVGALAAHRDGAIARPLWLSDQAWSLGVSPTVALVVLGGAAALALAGLLLLETRHRVPLLSPWLVPAAVLLLVWIAARLTWVEPPEAQGLAQIGEDLGQGQEAPPQGGKPEAGDGGGGGQAQAGDADGGGQPQQGDGGGQAQQGGGGEPQQGDGSGQAQQGGGGQSGQGDGGGGQAEQGDGGGGQPQQGDGGGGQAQQGDGDGGPAQQSDDQSQSGQPRGGEGEGGGEDAPDPKPVAVVLLEKDYEPPSELWYFRQSVLSQNNGRRLVPATRDDMDQDVLTHFPTAREAPRWTPPEEGRAHVRATVSLLVEHTDPFALESPTLFEPWPNPNPARFVRSWAFESLSQTRDYAELFDLSAGDPSWSPEARARYTEPPQDPRYAALAEEALARLRDEARGSPFAQALAMKLWLDEHMTYSTKARHAEAEDPTADFLFGDLTGYCVHAAHAMVWMMRTQGLPSRVATGYAVDAADRRGSAIIIRDHQAHAWAELYLEGFGWLPVDVSPANNLDPPSQPLDEQMADALADMARGEGPEETPRDNGLGQRPPPDLSWVLPSLVALLKGLLWALGLGLLPGHYAVKLWRRLVPRFAGPRALPRVSYRAALDALSELGFVRDEGETRERFARRLAETSPSFARLTELHLQGALGDPEKPPAPDLLRGALSAVQGELSQAAPGWRRALGWLNPFSFYQAR
ncbi:MAG: transglutaminase domain-containing protein [Alphaproteobacteria bacterium]|nr:transglutaminase domain-containing protein [Alphaproteobacteria bacterium]